METEREAFDFPVKRVPMRILYNGKELSTDKDAIIRTDTEKIVGYVSAATTVVEDVRGKLTKKGQNYYKIVKHKELVDAARGAIEKLQLQTVESDYLVNDGAKMYHHFDFPTEVIEPAVGDLVSMRLTLVNSYDLTKMAGFELGGNRLVCLNGLTSFQKAFFYMKKHAGVFTIDDTVKNMQVAIDTFRMKVLGYYKILGDTKLSVAAGMKVIQAFIDDKTLPEKYGEMVQSVWEKPSDANKVIAERDDENKIIPNTYRTIMGDPALDKARTLWTFYNAFTLILTHAVVSVERRMLIHQAVQRKLQTMVKK